MIFSPSQVVVCDPDAIRTRDRLLRRQMLYPAELPDLILLALRCKDNEFILIIVTVQAPDVFFHVW